MVPTHAQNMVTTDESTSRWAKPSVLVTNDDGVEAIGLLSIVRDYTQQATLCS